MQDSFADVKELTTIAKLLGEDNEKELKNKITELLLDRVESELDDMCNYLLDFELLFDEVRKEVETDLKDKLIKKYIEQVDIKLAKLFET